MRLLHVWPQLAQGLSGERRRAADRDLMVQVRAKARGPWEFPAAQPISPAHLGLLMLNGFVSREVVIDGAVSTELLGPGDVLRPWQQDDAAGPVAISVRWNVLARSQFAILDDKFALDVAGYPEIIAELLASIVGRSHRLAAALAIGHLNHVERRLEALLWHLAERWGHTSRDGVVLPLTLSHRLLGELVGARRPTVSTALSQLAEEARVRRLPDGTWLLLGGTEPAESEQVPEPVLPRGPFVTE